MKFTRRSLLQQSALAVASSSSLLALAAKKGSSDAEQLMYIGTYTRGASKGIYAYRFAPKTGKLTSLGLVAETENPSFLAIHPNHKYLYAVAESGKAGAVSAFSIDSKSGMLKKLNTVSSKGADPCYIRVDPTGKTVLVANYSSGTIAAMPVKDNGEIGEATSTIQHTGSGANKQRQSGPHAHSINPSPDNKFAIVADLGLDQVLVYRFDAAKSTLTPNDPPFTKLPAESGPRHFTFDPSGKFGYVIDEMNATVTAFTYDKARGALTSIQTVSTEPKDYAGPKSTAEVLMHPSGNFLYGSNRGDNTIAIFKVDKKTGMLTPFKNVSTQGKTPRNFNLDPGGNYLFAANQDEGGVVVFKVDSKTGDLNPTGEKLDVPFPVCIRFMPAGM